MSWKSWVKTCLGVCTLKLIPLRAEYESAVWGWLQYCQLLSIKSHMVFFTKAVDRCNGLLALSLRPPPVAKYKTDLVIGWQHTVKCFCWVVIVFELFPEAHLKLYDSVHLLVLVKSYWYSLLSLVSSQFVIFTIFKLNTWLFKSSK